jgi:hypothetical protein
MTAAAFGAGFIMGAITIVVVAALWSRDDDWGDK